jgi:hypothetical protein
MGLPRLGRPGARFQMGRLPPGYLDAIEAALPNGGAVSSAGEHFLDMEGAIGSIPIPPTTYSIGF